MKPSNLIIRIPEPCHEDWNAMQPDATGKFCQSCSKSVVDFSNKTDAEIGDLLLEYKGRKVCGHFKTSQVNRPLNLRVNLAGLPRNMSSTRIFAIAVFIVFGTLLFSCTNFQGQKLGKVELEAPFVPYSAGMPDFMEEELLKGDTLITGEDSVSVWCPSGMNIKGDMVVMDEPLTGEIVTAGPPDTSLVKEEFITMGMIMPVDPEETDSNAVSEPDSLLTRTLSRIPDQTESRSEEPLLLIYPNPGNGEFTLQYDVLKRSSVRADVFDVNGNHISTLVNVRDQYEGQYYIPVNLNYLAKGIYIVSFINNGKQRSERIVIEK